MPCNNRKSWILITIDFRLLNLSVQNPDEEGFTLFYGASKRFYKGLYPAGIYLPEVINRKTRTRCEICSKLTVKTPERPHWCHSGVFIVNFEHISKLVLVFLMSTLNM